MSININAKNDYFFLFSGLGSGTANAGSSNFLSDYMSIKNGSYGKLMKAYYGTSSNSSVKSIVNNKTTTTTKENLTSEDKKAYAKVESAADALKDSADALLSSALFKEKDITTTDENGVKTTTKGYDTDAIYKAVNNFVTKYNETLKAGADVDNSSITNRMDRLTSVTLSNRNLLNKIGVAINEDGSLSLDKDTFMKANMTTVKSLFNGNGSYGYQVSAQASLLNYAADRAANQSVFYNTDGYYSDNFSSGNLFNSYF